MKKQRILRKVKRYTPVTVAVVIIAIAGVIWYKDYTSFITTDDAHVELDNVNVSAKMLGRLSKIYVEEGDTVRAGQLLAELDSTDILAQKRQALAGLLQAEAAKLQAEAKCRLDEDNVKIAQINLNRTQEDFDRAKTQYAGDVITKEQYDHIRKAFETAKAQLESARTQVQVSRTQVNTASTAIGTANAQTGLVQAQINNTKLYAPCDGVIAKRWLLPGDVAQPGQSIYTINSSKKSWIIIYLEETKMNGVHLGQDVNIHLDAFSKVDFKGKIFSIASGTASQFSLIPASNASGNFTKVTQRIAIKISIDSANNRKSVSEYPILNGMSAEVKIIKD
jgi:membrane fusion protein (multidrug efflux system)